MPDYEQIVPEWCRGCVFAANAVRKAKEKSVKMAFSQARSAETEFGELFVGCHGLEENKDIVTCADPKEVCTNVTPVETAFNWVPSILRAETSEDL
jgi:hypothetical protein